MIGFVVGFFYMVKKPQVLLTEVALKISYNELLTLHYSFIKSQTLVEQHYYSMLWMLILASFLDPKTLALLLSPLTLIDMAE